jgi:hypothetical protein
VLDIRDSKHRFVMGTGNEAGYTPYDCILFWSVNRAWLHITSSAFVVGVLVGLREGVSQVI